LKFKNNLHYTMLTAFEVESGMVTQLIIRRLLMVSIVLKDLLKRLIIYYLFVSYRLGIFPSRYLTQRFPGNNGYHFDEYIQEGPDARTAHSKYINSLSKMPNPSNYLLHPLQSTKVLIALSNRASHKYHLREMAYGLGKTLSTLGSEIDFLRFNGKESAVEVNSRVLSSDIVLLNSEMTKAEIDVLLKIVQDAVFAHKPKLLMVIYDLWRPYDIELVHSMLSYVDGFLHMDQTAVNKHFMSHQTKFNIWPIARFWDSATRLQESAEGNKQEKNPLVFFSGSVRQIDRREILDSCLRSLRPLRLSSNFLISDPLAPNLILTEKKYLTEITRSEAIIAPSQKTSQHFILTGRTVEILASLGAGVLLQQEHSDCKTLGSLLRKDIDYLSFHSKSTLKEKLNFIDKYPSEAQKIAENGRCAILELFSSSTLAEPFLN
jgi:hypothetical protein